MPETPDQLQRTIAAKRAELDDNITALDTKAKELVDWRAQFEQRPLVVLGAAFAGGVVVAALLGGSRSRRRVANDYQPRYQSASASALPPEDTIWHRLREAIGVVAAGAAMELIKKSAPDLMERLIDPVREHMARGDTSAGKHRDAIAFGAPLRPSGYNASDAA